MVNINKSMQKRHKLKRLGEHKVKLTNKHTRTTLFFLRTKDRIPPNLCVTWRQGTRH